MALDSFREENLERLIQQKEREIEDAKQQLEEHRREKHEAADRLKFRPCPEAKDIPDAELGALLRNLKLEAVLSVLRGGLRFVPNEDAMESMKAGGLLTVADLAYMADKRTKEGRA